jgi:hypothetical protein
MRPVCFRKHLLHTMLLHIPKAYATQLHGDEICCVPRHALFGDVICNRLKDILVICSKYHMLSADNEGLAHIVISIGEKAAAQIRSDVLQLSFIHCAAYPAIHLGLHCLDTGVVATHCCDWFGH